MTASHEPFAPLLWVSNDTNLTIWRNAGVVQLPRPNISGITSSGDAHLWHDERRSIWRLLLSGISNGAGMPPTILLYESTAESALVSWYYVGPFYSGATGANRLECPGYAAATTPGGMNGNTNRAALLLYDLPQVVLADTFCALRPERSVHS